MDRKQRFERVTRDLKVTRSGGAGQEMQGGPVVH